MITEFETSWRRAKIRLGDQGAIEILAEYGELAISDKDRQFIESMFEKMRAYDASRKVMNSANANPAYSNEPWNPVYEGLPPPN